ncbi:serine hydrolase domain-containing protein [Endozoicomonas arenosclerae]|uniref:serine hydrolase domain-containing protein n=1 Tax=Endozoicomonas arenosclerae TaxID=1633495 RepID=UPI0007808131|nr:serine hydrolase [Endozoicomonas arenosclerae]
MSSLKELLFNKSGRMIKSFIAVSIACTFSTSTLAQDPIFPVPTWQSDTPENHDFDSTLLQDTSSYAESINSDSLLIIRNGHIIWEEYWNGLGQTTPQKNVWSVTKSFTSILVGIAQDQGHLSINDKASDYISQWQGGSSDSVTIKQLLANSSGRHHSIFFDNWYFRNENSVGKSDMTGYAIGRSQQSTPGTVWRYNNLAIQTLDRVLSVATGISTASYATSELVNPLGMLNTTVFTDNSGQMIMPSHMKTTARDMARLGYLFLNDGNWNGQQIVPHSYVTAATSPGSSLNAAYGFLWWLNTGPNDTWLHPAINNHATQTGVIFPDAPADLYAASGNNGQVVIVSPSENLIIVRQGHVKVDGPEIINGLYREVAAAMTN